MTCKICGDPRDIGDHSDCAASLEIERRPRKANTFIPLESDGEYEDLRDVEIYIQSGDDGLTQTLGG